MNKRQLAEWEAALKSKSAQESWSVSRADMRYFVARARASEQQAEEIDRLRTVIQEALDRHYKDAERLCAALGESDEEAMRAYWAQVEAKK